MDAGDSTKKVKGKNMKIKTMMTMLALGASALAVNAQDAGGPPPPGGPGGPGLNGRRPPPPLMLALDLNHDGVIDADEIANAPAALKALDKNGDGKLMQDELRPPRPENAANGDPNDPPRWDGPGGGRGGPSGANGRRPPPDPLMQALDVNHDGVIDTDEIANAPAALKMLDANGDGKLTRDELRPPRPPQDGGPESGYGRPPGPPPGQ
jgi:hypothetical protein